MDYFQLSEDPEPASTDFKQAAVSTEFFVTATSGTISTRQLLSVDTQFNTAGSKDNEGVASCHVIQPMCLSEGLEYLGGSFPNTSLPLCEVFDQPDKMTLPAPQDNFSNQSHTVKDVTQEITHFSSDLSVPEPSLPRLIVEKSRTPSDCDSVPAHDRVPLTPTPPYIPVVTYADATNIAAMYPELAATVLSMPLPHATPLTTSSINSASTARDGVDRPCPSMRAHSADRPNWALAPDPDQDLAPGDLPLRSRIPPSSKFERKFPRTNDTNAHLHGGAKFRSKKWVGKSRDICRVAGSNHDLVRNTQTPMPPNTASLSPPVRTNPSMRSNVDSMPTPSASPVALRTHAETSPNSFSSEHLSHEASASKKQQVLGSSRVEGTKGRTTAAQESSGNSSANFFYVSSNGRRTPSLEPERGRTDHGNSYTGSRKTFSPVSDPGVSASRLLRIHHDPGAVRGGYLDASPLDGDDGRKNILPVSARHNSGSGLHPSLYTPPCSSLRIYNETFHRPEDLPRNLAIEPPPITAYGTSNFSYPRNWRETLEGHDDYHQGEEGRDGTLELLAYRHPSQHLHPELNGSILNHDSSHWSEEQTLLSRSERNYLSHQEWLGCSGRSGQNEEGSRDLGHNGRHGGWVRHEGDQSDPRRLCLSSGAGLSSSYDEPSHDGSNGSTYGMGCDPQKHYAPLSYGHDHQGSVTNTGTIPDSVTGFWQDIHDTWGLSATETSGSKLSGRTPAPPLPQSSKPKDQQQITGPYDYGTFYKDRLVRPTFCATSRRGRHDQTLLSRGFSPESQEPGTPLTSYEDAIRSSEEQWVREGFQPSLLPRKSAVQLPNQREIQLSSWEEFEQETGHGHLEWKGGDNENFGFWNDPENSGRRGSVLPPMSFLPLNDTAEAGFHNNPPPPQVLADINSSHSSFSKSSDPERSGMRQVSLAPYIATSQDVCHEPLEKYLYIKRPTSQSAETSVHMEGYIVPSSSPKHRSVSPSGAGPALHIRGMRAAVVTPPLQISVEAKVSDAVRIPRPQSEAPQSFFSTDTYPQRQGRSVVRSDPEEVCLGRSNRAASTNWKLGWRAQSPSPKYVPPPARSGATYHNVEAKKYGLISSGTPIPSFAEGQRQSPFRDARQRINTPPLLPVNRFELLGKQPASTSFEANDSTSTSWKPSECREGGKENLTSSDEIEQQQV